MLKIQFIRFIGKWMHHECSLHGTYTRLEAFHAIVPLVERLCSAQGTARILEHRCVSYKVSLSILLIHYIVLRRTNAFLMQL